MIVHRTGKTSQYRDQTDRKLPEEYLEKMGKGDLIRMDITVDKSGSRHSEVLIHVEPEDIVALTKKYLFEQRDEIKALKKKIDELKVKHRLEVQKLNDKIRRHQQNWDEVYDLSFEESPTDSWDEISNRIFSIARENRTPRHFNF